MEYEEEQEMEIESMQAIFTSNEFELLSSNSYILHLSADANPDIYKQLDLKVIYPKLYPSIPAVLNITNVKGIDKHIDELTSKMNEIAQEELGDIYIYQIADMLKEWLNNNNHAEKSLYEQMIQEQDNNNNTNILQEKVEDDNDNKDEKK